MNANHSGPRPDDETVSVLEATVHRLEAEVDGLRTALRTRGVIEQAKGVLVATEGLTPELAFDRLRALSQSRNLRLVEVAAALVGVTLPDDGGADPDLSRRARDQLSASAAASAAHGDALAAEILAAAADVGASAAVVYQTEEDGALELVGGAGFAEDLLSAWSRIPPHVDVPLVAAHGRGEPVFLRDRRARTQAYSGSRRVPSSYQATASLPVTRGGHVLGVVGLAWVDAVDVDDAGLRARVEWVAGLAAPYLAEAHESDSGGRRAWLQALLEVLPCPGVVLDPVHDAEGRVVDLVVDLANDAAQGASGGDGDALTGRLLLAVWPEAASVGVFAAVAQVAATGRPAHVDLPGWTGSREGRETVGLRAVRVGRRVLVTWSPRVPA